MEDGRSKRLGWCGIEDGFDSFLPGEGQRAFDDVQRRFQLKESEVCAVEGASHGRNVRRFKGVIRAGGNDD